MARISRTLQKIFSLGASNNGVVGSLQANTRIDSNDLPTIQSLPAWNAGLSQVVVGGQQVIPLEEMNSLHYVVTYQLAYLFQEGLPEYDSATTYYINSIVKKPNTYQIYGSKVDNNTNVALTNTTNWQFLQDLSNPSVSFLWCGIATGTSNALILTPASAITSYVAGRPIEFIPAANNVAGAITVNISSIGTRNLAKGTNTIFGANELKAGKMVLGIDDGTNIQIIDSPTFSRGIDVASASTINLDTATGSIVDITGTTNIANITLAEGELRVMRFVNSITLQNTGNLVLPGTANIITRASDTAIAIGYPSGIVRILYFRADGTALISNVAWGNISGFVPSSISSGSLTVSAGQVTDSTNSTVISKSTTTSWLASNGNAVNGYQGGTSLPATSTIHFFAISGTSGQGVFASQSMTPTIPSGYSLYRRIFSLNTNGSAALVPGTAFEINGGGMQYWFNTEINDVAGTVGTTRQLFTLTIPFGIRTQPLGMATNLGFGGSNAGILISSPDGPDVTPDNATRYDILGAAGGTDSIRTTITSNASSQIAARGASANSNFSYYTQGFIDYRRN